MSDPNRRECSYSEKPNSSDLISRQEALKALRPIMRKSDYFYEILKAMQDLPSAQPDYQEVLGWLLAYHTISFDLHGRYLPHEVISWLINDFTKEFIAGRGQNE